MSRLTCFWIAIAIQVVAFHVGAAEPRFSWGERLQWTEENGPEGREHGAIVLDQARARALLIGGSGYNPYLAPLADVWQFDLKNHQWAHLESVQGVPAGGSRRVAALPDQKLAYLFGGYGDQAKPNNELFRFDYGQEIPTFTTVEQENAPPERSLHAFCYDAQSDRFFLYGGIGNQDQILGDTWSMHITDGRAVWTKLAVSESPSPRYGFFSGYDSRQGRLLIFSGAQGLWPIDPAQDTWALTTRTEPPAWKLMLDANAMNVPAGRRNGCSGFDANRQLLFVFGGTADARTSAPGLFVLDVRNEPPAWRRLNLENEPPLRSSGMGFYDPDRERLLFGFGNTTMQVFRDLVPLF